MRSALIIATTITAVAALGTPVQAASRPARVSVTPGISDTPPVTPAVVKEVNRLRKIGLAKRGQRVAGPIEVSVVGHIIKPRRGNPTASFAQVRETVDILNDSFAGGQSETSADAGVHFTLTRVHRSYYTRPRMYAAQPFTYYDRKMRRHFHTGGADTLNLYFVNPRPTPEGTTLGWSSFPWEYLDTPGLDGVSINVNSLPGGSFDGFNLGDTGVHEVGHWFGLLHTFEGGGYDTPICDPINDTVADTPVEGLANFGTPPDDTDTCPDDPGFDPIHNFMDYVDDIWMYEFTNGQSAVISGSWSEYRAP